MSLNFTNINKENKKYFELNGNILFKSDKIVFFNIIKIDNKF